MVHEACRIPGMWVFLYSLVMLGILGSHCSIKPAALLRFGEWTIEAYQDKESVLRLR